MKNNKLYGASIPAINQYVDSLIKAGEIDSATIKYCLIVQNEGKRVVQRKADNEYY